MLESIVGWLLVVILSTAIFVAYGLVEVEISFFRKGRIVLGLLVLIVDTLAWLLAVWIVLLGPAALSLMKPRS